MSTNDNPTEVCPTYLVTYTPHTHSFNWRVRKAKDRKWPVSNRTPVIEGTKDPSNHFDHSNDCQIFGSFQEDPPVFQCNLDPGFWRHRFQNTGVLIVLGSDPPRPIFRPVHEFRNPSSVGNLLDSSCTCPDHATKINWLRPNQKKKTRKHYHSYSCFIIWKIKEYPGQQPLKGTVLLYLNSVRGRNGVHSLYCNTI